MEKNVSGLFFSTTVVFCLLWLWSLHSLPSTCVGSIGGHLSAEYKAFFTFILTLAIHALATELLKFFWELFKK